MAHQDGRCASTAETVVVTSTSGNLPAASLPSGIRLVVIKGAVTGTIAWTLSGQPTTIVGQDNGTLIGPDTSGTTATLKVTGGDLYVRNLAITAGSPGVWATGGAILRLDHVSVTNNTAGGILLDGAGFDIKNTTISTNGPNVADASFGGVRIQNAPSSSTVPKAISLSTINDNQLVGVSCGTGTTLSPTPTSVLVSGNTGADIGGSCGFTSCGTAGPTCGAQP